WVDDTTSGKSPVLRNAKVIGTSWTPTTPLTPGDTYRWWVRGLTNSGVSSSWSSATVFTLTRLPTPVLVSPTGSTLEVSPVFNWNAVTGATHYYLWVQDVASGAVVVQNQNVTDVTYTAPALTPRHSFKWWVRASNDTGDYSAWSTPLTFTIQAPAAPT